MVGFYLFIPSICGQSSDLTGLGARVCSLHGAAGNVTHGECHTQGMSHTGNVTCRNVSTSLSHRPWSIPMPAVDPGPPFPLPEMLPGPPCCFTITCPLHRSFSSFVSSFPSLPTPFPHLLFPFPAEEAIFFPCPAHPSPAELRSRPLPWDSALAGGSAGKLLGWQTSTWAH